MNDKDDCTLKVAKLLQNKIMYGIPAGIVVDNKLSTQSAE